MNKVFDCVEMKRQSGELIFSKVSKMTIAEQLDYWRKGSESLYSIFQQQKTVSHYPTLCDVGSSSVREDAP